MPPARLPGVVDEVAETPWRALVRRLGAASASARRAGRDRAGLELDREPMQFSAFGVEPDPAPGSLRERLREAGNVRASRRHS